MLVILDLDRQKLVRSAGNEPVLTEAVAKRSSVGVIAIQVVNGGVPVTEAVSGLQLKFAAKDPGEYDQTPLVSTTTFEWIATRSQYEATVNWITARLNARFGVQGDAISITGEADTDLITSADLHELSVGDRVWFPTIVGPTQITAEEGTWYYVKTTPSPTTFTITATPGGAVLDFTTDISSGTFRSDPADDATIPLAFEVGWRFDSGDEWRSSENEVALTLRNNIIRDDDGAPADPEAAASLEWLNDHAVRHDAAQSLSQLAKVQALQNINLIFTALTGGGAGALDSLVTAGGLVTEPALFDVVIANSLQRWLFRAGTDAEDGISIVRPDDFHASTNAFVFQKVL